MRHHLLKMMEEFLEGNTIDTVLKSVFGSAVLLSQRSSEESADGWRTRTVEAVTADGYMHTYVSSTKIDGTERKYHEKVVEMTVEDLEKLEAAAVAARDYKRAQTIKEAIDKMRRRHGQEA